MAMTEREALNRWCFKSMGVSDVDVSDIGVNRHVKKGFPVSWPEECGCLASRCMAWEFRGANANGEQIGGCGLIPERSPIPHRRVVEVGGDA